MFQSGPAGAGYDPHDRGHAEQSTHAKSEGCAPQAVRHERQGGRGQELRNGQSCHCSGFARLYGRHVDIHGPSVPRLLGASASVMADENGKMLPVPCGERMSLISMDSFLKDKDTAILWRGPKKTGAIRQFLTDVQWGALDYLVIDSPPGTGDEHLTVLDAIPDAGCIVVTTPQEISLADVRKALDFLKQVQAPVLGIVENMSGLSCPHCGKEIDLFKKGGGEQLAKQYELPFLGAIPLDPATVIAADRGVPVVSLTENSPARQGFMALADAVIAATEAE